MCITHRLDLSASRRLIADIDGPKSQGESMGSSHGMVVILYASIGSLDGPAVTLPTRRHTSRGPGVLARISYEQTQETFLISVPQPGTFGPCTESAEGVHRHSPWQIQYNKIHMFGEFSRWSRCTASALTGGCYLPTVGVPVTVVCNSLTTLGNFP
ncbi:hypothetical protein BS47DRAFT_1072758 [Hydnum rufescens UP504]|uniref:Uncharacterized protein n=1 Tax=Hydnum rufescens UP504 TaxID=1448309 RepID=A0A9P6E1J8_9AGAM|nr:hypothetical protein BS47DRAFT_1072758 [Hydnum rufescens UP504]